VDHVDKVLIVIPANIHEGFSENIDLCELAKNAP